jgi:hypothetical protein
MNKIFCKHSGCKYFYNLNKNGFCDFHQEELDNNGKPGHVTCSWCTEYKEKQQETEDMIRSRFDCGERNDPYFWDSRESI